MLMKGADPLKEVQTHAGKQEKLAEGPGTSKGQEVMDGMSRFN